MTDGARRRRCRWECWFFLSCASSCRGGSAWRRWWRAEGSRPTTSPSPGRRFLTSRPPKPRCVRMRFFLRCEKKRQRGPWSSSASCAAQVASRWARNAAGTPLTALSFASLPNGLPEEDTCGKCCCSAVRTDANGEGGVAVVMGVAEANVLVDTLVLRVPDAEGGEAGRCWVTLPPFGLPRAHFGVCSIGDGRVVVAGGVDATGALLDSVELYDAAARTWVEMAPLLAPRACCAALPLPDGGMAVLGGILGAPEEHVQGEGESEDGAPPFGEVYSLRRQGWLPLPSITGLEGRPLHGLSAAAVGDCIVVGGGSLADGGERCEILTAV